MASVRVEDLKATFDHVDRSTSEPTWDFTVYCRFLAGRLPEAGAIDGAELGRLAEELIADVKEGVDRARGHTFDPPLLRGRSDLVYNYFRAKLGSVAEKVGGADFARAMSLRPVPVAPPAAAPVAAAQPAAPPPATG
jgi:hypothetical protein